MTPSADRMRAKRLRDRRRGIVETTVQVPEDRIDELRALVAGWCADHQERQRLEDTGQRTLDL